MSSHFATYGFAFALLLLCCSPASAQNAATDVQIHIEPQIITGHISLDFIGFGYETSAAAQTNYFSGHNDSLIHLYRNLTTNGLIRIGGNISDHAKYVPDGIAMVNTQDKVTVINHANLDHVAAFARATGWRVMWGLNLGTGTKAEAAQEAIDVAATFGDRLQSFQIGNEVDFHSHYDDKVTDYASYHSNYIAFKTGIRAVVPHAPFSGPDVGNNLRWFRDFATTESGDLQLLTHHYYRTDSKNPDATFANLLTAHPSWQQRLQALQNISQTRRVPYRINEINSFSGGGKIGISDTFASALWCLDNMFLLASYGCDGVNMETDINQFAWLSHYSPIVHDSDGHCRPCPEYYGMLAFSMSGHGDLLKVKCDNHGLNITAYATRNHHGTVWLTIINKDLAQNATVTVAVPDEMKTVKLYPLRAPSADSTNQIDFAGGQFDSDGDWAAMTPETLSATDAAVEFPVPHASAMLVEFSK